MLVLARRVGESIQIGPDITVMVTRIEDGRVKLGVMAPRDIAVDRTEVAESKHRNTRDRNEDILARMKKRGASR